MRGGRCRNRLGRNLGRIAPCVWGRVLHPPILAIEQAKLGVASTSGITSTTPEVSFYLSSYPDFWTGLIPVYGSSANAAAAFASAYDLNSGWGYAEGIGWTAAAVGDLFLIRTGAVGGYKFFFPKRGLFGPNTLGAAGGAAAVATEAEAVTAFGGLAAFGRLIRMGNGAAQALARASSITLVELQAAGVTLPVARYWLQFYQNAVANRRG